MQFNPEVPETQSLTSHSGDVIHTEQPSEQTSQTNFPIHNPFHLSQPPLQSHPLLPSSHLTRHHDHILPIHIQDSQVIGGALQQPQSYYGQFPVQQLTHFPSGSLKEGEAYALYVKDGAVYFKPYVAPPSVPLTDQFKNFDEIIRKNAPSSYRLFLYVITTLSAVNIILSLVALIKYSHLCLWLGFFLAIWMTAKGVCEIAAIYYKKMVRNNFELVMSMIYTFYFLTAIVFFALDMDRQRAR